MSGRNIIGVILVILGIGLMLDQMEIIQFGQIISTYWPAVLVVIGIIQLSRRSVAVVPGVFLTFLGIYLQIRRLEDAYDMIILPQNSASFFWPALLIIIGVTIILSRSRHEFVPAEMDEDRINNIALFSGIDNRNSSKNFRGGSITAVFGGADIDLTKATLAEEGATLDLTAAFGGIEIRVPEHWKVIVSGIPLFGGWDNSTRYAKQDAENLPILRVKCFAAFGGVEIKN